MLTWLVGKPSACGGGTGIPLPSGMSAKAHGVVLTSPLVSPTPDHLSGTGHLTRRTWALAHGPTAFKTGSVAWRNQATPLRLFWPHSLRDATRISTQVSFIISDAHYSKQLWWLPRNDCELRQASAHWENYKSKALYISACTLSLFLLRPPTMLFLQLLSYVFIMCLLLSHLTALPHCLRYDLLSLLMFS